jgi:subtilisin-like proprotein convertase family protein
MARPGWIRLQPAALLFILVNLVFITGAFADRPSDRETLMAGGQIGRWTSPAVNVPQLLLEDEANRGRDDIPYRIGLPMETDLSPGNSGTWETLADGGQVWRLQLRTDGALWTVLGFDVFQPAPGAELWVYDPESRDVQGPFGHQDIRGHGQLWFPPIAGDTLVVELYWPASLAGQEPELHLGTVSHGYKPFGVIGRELSTELVDESGACNIDVACPLGELWQDEKRGAVMLLSGGSGFCSGSLINTTANDCRTYLLTAAHCGAGASTTISFNYEKPACGSGTPPPTTNQTLSGATVLANYTASDVTLLEMDNAPPEDYGAFFNGWSRDTTAATEAFGIHHPSGDVKKISHNVDPLVDGTNYGPDHWRITEWEFGTTEGGSSGSPLFDQNHRIVGQLHGGQASCTNITWDEYGKIDVSWTGGGSPSSRLSDWLDPEGTGALTVDGIDHQACMFQPAGTVAFVEDLYACTDVVTLTLRDDSLQGNPSQDVALHSDTEAAPETATLLPIEPGSGRFMGTFPLTDGAPAGGDGQLSVSHADTVTVEYVDADDGEGGTNILRQDFRSVDCQPPAITNVTSSGVTGYRATITWDTDEPAGSTVSYGTDPGSILDASAAGLVTSHDLTLLGLAECSIYLYSVASTDDAGNAAVDDNLGAYYSFETGKNTRPQIPSLDTPIDIPDDDPAGISSTITVADDKIVEDVDVALNITHTYLGDLGISLVTPGGTSILLSDRRGGSNNNFVGTTFDDEAATPVASGAAPFTGSYQPDEPLSTADGVSAMGDWQLHVVDQAGIDLGTIDDWTLILTFATQECGPHATFLSYGLEADACVTGGAGGDGLWDAGEQVAFSVEFMNDGVDPLTGATATVTPLTAGVTMLDGTADLGTVAAGTQGATAAPHVMAQLPWSLACGTEVQFDVALDSNEGSWSGSFSQTVGVLTPSFGGTFSEDFNGGSLPAGWSVVDGGSVGDSWFIDSAGDPAGCGNPDPAAPIGGSWAAVDSDCAGNGKQMDEELISPALDLTGNIIVTLEFDHWFAYDQGHQAELADVDVRSSQTGGQWVNVGQWTGASTANPAHESIDISAQAGDAADVEVRWHYYNAKGELYWYVDNITISYGSPGSCAMTLCSPPSGGSPSPVPDGSAGTTPMQVTSYSLDGSEIVLEWDDQCAPAGTKILFGPLDQVSTYGIAGASCDIVNPEIWGTVPAGDVWFLLVGEDTLGLESSWGQATGGERGGLATSATCTSTAKDLAGSCP